MTVHYVFRMHCCFLPHSFARYQEAESCVYMVLMQIEARLSFRAF